MTSARVDAYLVQLLAHAERRVSARIAEALEAQGGSLEQWRVLCLLAERDGSPMNEIAAHAMLPPPTLTKVVDRMVAANLVHRRADDRDRRRVLVFLTGRGRDLCKTLTREVRRYETELASPGFDRERLAELLSQLISEVGLRRGGARPVQAEAGGEARRGGFHVSADQGENPLLVAIADGLQDRVMLAEPAGGELTGGIGVLQGADAHPGLDEQGAGHPGQPRASRQQHQRLVVAGITKGDRRVVTSPGRLPHPGADLLQPGGRGGHGERVTAQDQPGGGLLDRVAGDVDVEHVGAGQLAHEEAAVPLPAQQPLGGEALHGFPERAPAHVEAAGQVRLAELAARRQGPVPDGGAQPPGDNAGGGFAADRPDPRRRRHRHPAVPRPLPARPPARCAASACAAAACAAAARPANSAPGPERARVSPASRSPSHTVTWLAVSPGLPSSRSSRPASPAVRMAVSGTRSASASGLSWAVTSRITSSSPSAPTSAAVRMPPAARPVTSRPPASRKAANRPATSSG